MASDTKKLGTKSILASINVPEKILSVNFNQDMGCFTCCTENGVRVYNTDPLYEMDRLALEDVGSVSQAQMIYRSNVLGIVSGGSRPKFPDNSVRIYCFKRKYFSQMYECHSKIKAFRIRKDMLVVASLNHIHVFSFPYPSERLFTLETPTNEKGLLEISPNISCEKQVIIFPGMKPGSVLIVDILEKQNRVKLSPTVNYFSQFRLGIEGKPPTLLHAHESDLHCIALSQQGTKIATASVRGTLIRIWDTATLNQLVELRRGSDPANIYSMRFSLNTEYLCCSSDKGTIHLFAIEKLNLNKRLSVPNAPNVLGKYGESLWAFANATLPPECPSVVGFGDNDTFVALGMDGTFHQYTFSEDRTCTRKVFDIYLKASNASLIYRTRNP